MHRENFGETHSDHVTPRLCKRQGNAGDAPEDRLREAIVLLLTELINIYLPRLIICYLCVCSNNKLIRAPIELGTMDKAYKTAIMCPSFTISRSNLRRLDSSIA